MQFPGKPGLWGRIRLRISLCSRPLRLLFLPGPHRWRFLEDLRPRGVGQNRQNSQEQSQHGQNQENGISKVFEEPGLPDHALTILALRLGEELEFLVQRS